MNQNHRIVHVKRSAWMNKQLWCFPPIVLRSAKILTSYGFCWSCSWEWIGIWFKNLYFGTSVYHLLFNKTLENCWVIYTLSTVNLLVFRVFKINTVRFYKTLLCKNSFRMIIYEKGSRVLFASEDPVLHTVLVCLLAGLLISFIWPCFLSDFGNDGLICLGGLKV